MLSSNAVYPSRTSSSTHLISCAINAESDGLGQTSRSPQRALGPSIASIIAKLSFKFVLFDISYTSCNTCSPPSTTPQATPYSSLLWACSPAGPSRACTPCVAAWWSTHALPRCDAYRARRPPTASVAVAANLQSPMDVHVDCGLVGLPLAPVLPTRVRRLRRATRRSVARASRSVARRVRGVRGDPRPWDVGARAGDGVPHCGRILPLHGYRGAVRAWVRGWTLGWGTLMIDAWARRGIVTTPPIGFDQENWSSIPSFRTYKDNMMST